jgi:hypothetical protein
MRNQHSDSGRREHRLVLDGLLAVWRGWEPFSQSSSGPPYCLRFWHPPREHRHDSRFFVRLGGRFFAPA